VRRAVLPTAGAAGLVVLVIGTFLPWLRSGESQRNSYAAGNALRGLIDLPGILDALVPVWPYVGLWCAAVVAAYALGLRRWAGGLALVAGAVAAAVAIGALSAQANGFIGPCRSGPVVTLVGSVIVLGVSVWALVAPPRSVPH
jgi:hypothetical protein